MNALADKYAPRGVGSFFLYTGEAHPGENYPHLESMEQKLNHARALRDERGMGQYLDDVAAPDSRLAAFADTKRLRSAVEDFRAGGRAGLPDVLRLVNVECWLRSLPAGPA